jgi:hypothetical protein
MYAYVWFQVWELYMKICGEFYDCPKKYPWIGNPYGQ